MRDIAADCVLRQQLVQIVGAGDGRPIKADDDVAFGESGLCGRAVSRPLITDRPRSAESPCARAM